MPSNVKVFSGLATDLKWRPWQNTIEDLYNLMVAKGSTDFNVADSTTIGKLALRQDRNAWISELNGSNDDAGVSAMACTTGREAERKSLTR